VSTSHPRYITTLEGGWLVAVPIAGKRAVTKTFRGSSDERDALLAKAVAWRDRAHRRLLGGPVPARSFNERARESSATGEPGVRLVNKLIRKRTRAGGVKHYEVPFVLAEVHTIKGCNYRRPKGSRSRIWSLNKYDFEEAIALAVAWRSMMIDELRAG
jgi:hypothetical protein